MVLSSEEKRLELKRHRKIISEWKEYAKTIRDADSSKQMLMRDSRKISLARIEAAARTQGNFDNVLKIWDEMEIIEEWRLAKQETQSTDSLINYKLPDRETIIPQPFGDIWWRQLLRGDFLDSLNDCPFHMEDLTASRPVRDFIKELSDDQREILFYRAIRQWSPQKIAAIRNQTDRNIRKVYGNLIVEMRKKMYIQLWPRYIQELPLTNTQKEFMSWFWEQLNELEKGKLVRKFEEAERLKRKKPPLTAATAEATHEQYIPKDKRELGEI